MHTIVNHGNPTEVYNMSVTRKEWLREQAKCKEKVKITGHASRYPRESIARDDKPKPVLF